MFERVVFGNCARLKKWLRSVALNFIGELFESRTPLVLVGSWTCFVIRRFERVGIRQEHVHRNTIHMFVNIERL